LKLGKLKRYFIAGVLVLVPLVVTVYVFMVAFTFLQHTVGRHVDSLIQHLFRVRVQGIGVAASVLTILLVGVLTSTVIGSRLFRYGERTFSRIPVARAIYPSAKQIIEFLLSPKDPRFRKAVAIPYPVRGEYAIGFQTGVAPPEVGEAVGTRMVTVFVPTSPSPITGFTILVPLDAVIPLDMSIEEALKFIVSAGVLVTENRNAVSAVPTASISRDDVCTESSTDTRYG